MILHIHVMLAVDSCQNRDQLSVDFFAKDTSLLFEVHYKFNNGDFSFSLGKCIYY